MLYLTHLSLNSLKDWERNVMALQGDTWGGWPSTAWNLATAAEVQKLMARDSLKSVKLMEEKMQSKWEMTDQILFEYLGKRNIPRTKSVPHSLTQAKRAHNNFQRLHPDLSDQSITCQLHCYWRKAIFVFQYNPEKSDQCME